MAVDLRDELFRAVIRWDADLRAFLGCGAGAAGGGRLTVLTGGVEFLNTNFSRMLIRTDRALRFGVEVRGLFGSALRLVKNGPLRSHLGLPCPYCNRKTLVQQEGLVNTSWYTSCESRLGGCGRLFTETEMTWMADVRLAMGA